MSVDTDYVLGTHDAEISRLHLQHGIWQTLVRDCWARAGITPGQHVIDIGCGPGFASVDLAEAVGPEGRVTGIERSERFIAHAEALCAARGLENVSFRHADVMLDALAVEGADAIWCRWLAIFVSDPALLVRKMAAALKPGGRLVFHEYVHYETYQSIPHSMHLEQFVRHVMDSWREFGGEPNVARMLPIIWPQPDAGCWKPARSASARSRTSRSGNGRPVSSTSTCSGCSSSARSMRPGRKRYAPISRRCKAIPMRY